MGGFIGGQGVAGAKASAFHQQTASECNTSVPVDPRRLESILTWTQAAIEDVGRQQLRLSKAMDYILGSEPEPTGQQDKCNPRSPAFISEAEDKFRLLAELLQAVNRQIDRLERVVG